MLAYATPVPPRDLIWVGRDGRPLGVAAGAGDYVDFRLSPDHRYLAAAEVGRDSERSDLRLIDLVRGDNPRLTTSPATDASPVWSPDGTRLAFRSNRESRHDLYVRPAAAGGSDAVLLKTPASKYPTDWSPDGTFVVYHSFDQRSRYDIWAAPVRAEGATRPLVRTDFDDIQGQVSPSGRWLAYASNESSRFEVYVQPLLADGRKWQVSVDGGSDPRWRADEKELFFLGRDGRVISVGLTGGTSFRAAIPRPLFQLQDVAPVKPPYLSAYDAQRDGQRFVVPRTPESLEQHPFTVIVNWQIPRRPVNTPAQER